MNGMGRLVMVNSSCHIWHICVQTKVLFNICFSTPSQTSQIYVELVVSVYITNYNCMLISFLNFDRKSQRKKGFCTISCYCRKRVLWNKYLIVCLQDKQQQTSWLDPHLPIRCARMSIPRLRQLGQLLHESIHIIPGWGDGWTIWGVRLNSLFKV